MKIIIALLASIVGASLSAETVTTIHDRCWDGTFAYNYMTLQESESNIIFILKGSTLFAEPGEWLDKTTTISIQKDKCRQSDDKLLVNCWAHEVDVRQNWKEYDSESGEYIDKETARVSSLNPIGVSYVESVSAHHRDFNFYADEFVDGQVRKSSAFFTGPRATGCNMQFPR